MNEKNFRSGKSLWTRVADSLFGAPRHQLSRLDVHDMNGVVYIGEYEVSKEEAIAIAVEILRRAK